MAYRALPGLLEVGAQYPVKVLHPDSDEGLQACPGVGVASPPSDLSTGFQGPCWCNPALLFQQCPKGGGGKRRGGQHGSLQHALQVCFDSQLLLSRDPGALDSHARLPSPHSIQRPCPRTQFKMGRTSREEWRLAGVAQKKGAPAQPSHWNWSWGPRSLTEQAAPRARGADAASGLLSGQPCSLTPCQRASKECSQHPREEAGETLLWVGRLLVFLQITFFPSFSVFLRREGTGRLS